MSTLSALSAQSRQPSATGERTLTHELIAHSASAERQALLARAEARAAERLQQLEFVDTRPPLYRSEAFVEDLAEAGAPPPAGLMRGLAGFASQYMTGIIMLGSVLSAWSV
ncbi:hypothetical protein [Roseateles violae]|uniref:Uncharacterized protein n=1 Tax=Roseateles violae TaxID=3058042 RepID=A0ABT8DYF0_9BURK|nr:hypothetical protein [Pelomonas sp. PFR6]MDN3922559.1 hypothetical protein [Pelomonas sp. PFR6]